MSVPELGNAAFLFERGVITLRSPSQKHETSIRLHGAHVTSFKSNGKELLYLSEQMPLLFEQINQDPNNRAAIRGGIPLIFPQFGSGSIQNHGFARNVNWNFVDGLKATTSDSNSHVEEGIPSNSNTVILELRDDDYSRIWPHPFVATYKVSLDDNGKLFSSLTVNNTGSTPFTFQVALHTYFKVSSISNVKIEGLKGKTFINKVKGGERQVEERPFIDFDSEVDSVYLNAPNEILIQEASSTIVVTKSDSLKDAVVWNPWAEKNSKTKDMSPEDYKVMVCVEAGAIDPVVSLGPGETWTGTQFIQYLSKRPEAHL